MKVVRSLLVVILVILVVVLILLRLRPKKVAQLAPEEAVPVMVALPRVEDIVVEVTFTGTVAGEEEAYVFPDLPGKFLKYAVEEGKSVEKGDAIAYLEREVPGLEYQPIVVKSPIAGRVSLLGLARGQPVAPTTPIARVAKVDRVKVTFTVPDQYLNSLKVGKKVRISWDTGEEAQGSISWYSMFLDPLARTAEVHCLVDNPDGRLVPGMYVKVRLVVRESRNALTVPYEAVLGTETRYVYIVKGQIARKRPVTVGIYDQHRIEVKEGLSPTDSVVVAGQHNLEDGLRVRLKGVELP